MNLGNIMTLRVRQLLSTNVHLLTFRFFLVCPSLLPCVFALLGPHSSSPPNVAFVENVYHNIYERVRPVSKLALPVMYSDPLQY